eukprot:2413392-Pleurochrysis_carterae.AAC.1
MRTRSRSFTFLFSAIAYTPASHRLAQRTWAHTVARSPCARMSARVVNERDARLLACFRASLGLDRAGVEK